MNRTWARSDAELAETLQDWSQTRLYALDTEFVHRRTFYARPGLIQLVRPGECLFIDPCADIADWRPLADFFSQPRDCLIYAPREDLRLLHRLAGAAPQHFLDIQFAAALLGHPVQLGLATLVSALFGTELSKESQQLDWTRRPIPEAALNYACTDAAVLLDCWREMQPQLAERGRLDWLRDETRHTLTGIFDDAPVATNTRVGKSPESRRCLRELALCRMELARERDLPQRWIVDDATLGKIARAMPGSVAGVSELLSAKQARRLSKHLFRAVERARRAPDSAEPPRLPGAGARLSQSRQLLTEAAQGLGVEEPLFCNRAQLEHFSRSGELPAPMLSGWRREHLGAQLLGLL